MARPVGDYRNRCPEGYYFDASVNRCRRKSDDPGTCPQGYQWNAEKQRCVQKKRDQGSQGGNQPPAVGSTMGWGDGCGESYQPGEAYGPAPEAPRCQPGFHWDDIYDRCIQDQAENCPDHMQWDVVLARCVPLNESCPPGMELDPVAGVCVAVPEPEEHDCPPGEKWNAQTGRCERTQDQQSEDETALDTIRATLESYGLGALTNWAWEQLLENRTIDQIYADLRDQPLYQERFAGNFIRQEAGLPWLPEATYLAQVAEIQRLGRQRFGVHVDESSAANVIGRDVSLSEFDENLRMMSRMNELGPGVRYVFDNLVGRHLTDLELFNFVAQRGDQELRRLYENALYMGMTDAIGLGIRPIWEAERLRQAGKSPEEAFQIYTRILGALPDTERLAALDRSIEGDDAVPFNSFEALFGTFSGLDPDKQAEVLRLFSRETARFSTGGGTAFSGTGAVGALTSAQRRQPGS